MYTDLDDLICNSPNSAEIQRGIAVKQDLLGKKRSEIASILDKTEAFISKWRLIYDEYGVNGLQSMHQGGRSQSLLSVEERSAILLHIQSHEVFGPVELMEHIKLIYKVRFKSMQSYYTLLHEAGMSWHKSQKTNPRRDSQSVIGRRQEIKKNSENVKNR